MTRWAVTPQTPTAAPSPATWMRRSPRRILIRPPTLPPSTKTTLPATPVLVDRARGRHNNNRDQNPYSVRQRRIFRFWVSPVDFFFIISSRYQIQKSFLWCYWFILQVFDAAASLEPTSTLTTLIFLQNGPASTVMLTLTPSIYDVQYQAGKAWQPPSRGPPTGQPPGRGPQARKPPKRRTAPSAFLDVYAPEAAEEVFFFSEEFSLKKSNFYLQAIQFNKMVPVRVQPHQIERGSNSYRSFSIWRHTLTRLMEEQVVGEGRGQGLISPIPPIARKLSEHTIVFYCYFFF